MESGTKQGIGWSAITLGVLVGLNQWLAWPAGLQYTWATLVVIIGIWVLMAK